MKKVIRVDLDDETELFEKYDSTIASRDLIDYILESAKEASKKDKIKIEIYKKNISEDSIRIIKEGLKAKYKRNTHHKRTNDIKQIFMLLGGALSLAVATLIKETIFNEIALIGGWVLIWETIESNIFDDSKTKMENKLIEKLLKSEYTEAETK